MSRMVSEIARQTGTIRRRRCRRQARHQHRPTRKRQPPPAPTTRIHGTPAQGWVCRPAPFRWTFRSSRSRCSGTRPTITTRRTGGSATCSCARPGRHRDQDHGPANERGRCEPHAGPCLSPHGVGRPGRKTASILIVLSRFVRTPGLRADQPAGYDVAPSLPRGRPMHDIRRSSELDCPRAG